MFKTTSITNHNQEKNIPSVLRFSLSSAQLVDLAENTGAWLTEDGPFSPSFAKNSVRAKVFPFFFFAFLAATINTICHIAETTKNLCVRQSDGKSSQLRRRSKEKRNI